MLSLANASFRISRLNLAPGGKAFPLIGGQSAKRRAGVRWVSGWLIELTADDADSFIAFKRYPSLIRIIGVHLR